MSALLPVDALAACGAEPITLPGAIQPHGALLVLREPALTLAQASENLGPLLGLDARPGATLAEIVSAPVATLIATEIAASDVTDRPLLVGRAAVGKRPCDIIVHRHGGALLVEFEADPVGAPDSARPIYDLVRSFIARLRDADSTQAMCRIAALEVRRITGFGHTLVYAFDAEGHGEVLAEDVDADAGYPSYLGHRFPASDIPPQARDLYRRNHLRLIPDAAYRPAALVPRLHPEHGAPTDLSFAVLRSVSPVHLEYMRNMGTRASMSASIIVGGQLWGLISCHDAAARRVAYAVRAALEHLSQVLSLQIEGHEERREIDHRLTLRAQLVRLLEAMGRTDGALEHLVALPGAPLLSFAGAAGAAVVDKGRCHRVGAAPDDAVVHALVDWLAERGEDVYATDALGAVFAPAADLAPVASGLLAVAVSKLHRHYILWFRPEVARTLKWAGDPRLAKSTDAAGRLHPRSSFSTWQELRRGRSLPWRPSEVALAGEFRSAMLGIVLRKAEEVAALAGELARSNAELEAFAYSVSHDLRAPLRHIAGYADLIEDGKQSDISERDRRFIGNIKEAAGFAGSLVDALLSFSRIGRTGMSRVAVELDALVAGIVRTASLPPHTGIDWRIAALPAVQGDPLLLRLALENLIGNAVKYSAARRPPVIELAAVDDGPRHGVRVSDNGVGFDMKYAHKLFGVFQRLHSMDDFEGTGIGLANVRRIAERHGGSVTAEGAIGRGATFTLWLPKRLPVPENNS